MLLPGLMFEMMDKTWHIVAYLHKGGKDASQSTWLHPVQGIFIYDLQPEYFHVNVFSAISENKHSLHNQN